MADQDFQWFTMLDVEELGIDQIAKEAADRANDNVDGVFISWDIDTFDPAYAPGTGEPEPNGLTSREGMRLMRLLSTSFDADTFGFDLVEVCPAYDVSDVNSYNGGITSGLANRLIVELMAGLSLTKKGEREGNPVRPNLYREASFFSLYVVKGSACQSRAPASIAPSIHLRFLGDVDPKLLYPKKSSP